MKESIKKAICAATAALLMVIFTVAVTGCDKEPKEPKYEPPKNCDVVLEAEGGWEAPCEEAPCENFIIVCDTYEELQEELFLYVIEMFEESAIKVREYADEHEDKSFVVCFYVINEDNGPHRLREVEVIDGKLTMYIWRSWDTTASAVMGCCLFIAGVDKSFVANVTECEYVFV